MAMVIFKKKRDKHGQTRSFFSTFEEKNDVGCVSEYHLHPCLSHGLLPVLVTGRIFRKQPYIVGNKIGFL